MTNWIDRHKTTLIVASFWVVTRVLLLSIINEYPSDLSYYHKVATSLEASAHPYDDLRLDHGPLAPLLLRVGNLFSFAVGYENAFRGTMLLVDLLAFLFIAFQLKSKDESIRRRSLLLYTWLTTILFPFLLDRIDAWIMLFLVIACAALQARNYLLSTCALGAAALINSLLLPLLPILLFVDKFIFNKRTYLAPLLFIASIPICAFLFPGYFGMGLLRSAAYHLTGNLEVESLSGSLLALYGALGGDAVVDLSTGSARVISPSTQLIVLLSYATVLAATIAGIIRAKSQIQNSDQNQTLGLSILVVYFTLCMLLSRVLLPQYILWLVPLLCLLIVNVNLTSRWILVGAMSALATTATFPLLYASLVSLELLPVLLLVVRNSLLLIMLIWAVGNLSLELANAQS